MISRVASPAPRVPPATTGVPRSRRKAIGACASTPVLSSPWGASLLAPAASGAGLRSLSKDAPLPNFPASLGLHPNDASQESILSQRVAQLQQQIAGAEKQLQSVRRQNALIREEIVVVKDMYEKSYERKSRLLALQRSEADLAGQEGELLSRIAT